MISVSEDKPDSGHWQETALSHIDALYSFAMVLSRSRIEAEDLLQETYMRAVPHMAELRSDSNVKAWLFTIMRNAWLKQQRHRRRGPVFVALDDIEVLHTADDSDDPQEQCIRIWQREEIIAGLEQLPRHSAEIVVLCDIEGLSYREIADVLDCPIGTVMSRLARARAKLKRLLYQRLAPGQNAAAIYES